MTTSTAPLVSIVTPVYNGGPYLAECIESVLAQSYTSWEYAIVNNCSSDDTLQIAERYAGKDSRIRVYSNDKLLDIIANHNRAFRRISPNAKYCKVVSADDWLFPDCLARMVSVAEEHPNVGIVGSYQLSGSGQDGKNWRVKWTELPYPSTVVSGREVCRTRLLGGPYVFGTPTSILYRADLVRAEESFYPNSTAEADTSACYKCLTNTDFGFVHQVLSYERVHEAAISAECRRLNTYIPSQLGDLLEYGSIYLSKNERDRRLTKLLNDYYGFLASSVFRKKADGFWAYHRRRLAACGYPLSRRKLTAALVAKVLHSLLNPNRAVKTMRDRVLATQ